METTILPNPESMASLCHPCSGRYLYNSPAASPVGGLQTEIRIPLCGTSNLGSEAPGFIVPL